MAAQLEPRRVARVALIGRADQVRGQLRAAVMEAGGEVVFEAEQRGVKVAELRAADAHTIIVNLDPGSEDALDAIDEVLSDPHVQVIFNESETSSQLAGWDLARWARHLISKVLGHGDATPPAPDGAERLPLRDLRLTDPGLPLTPAQVLGDVSLDGFAEEARQVRSAVPDAQMPDIAVGQGDSVVALGDAEAAIPAEPVMVELQIERPDPMSSIEGFRLDLDAIESSLDALGEPGEPSRMPRRLGADEPTVVLSRSELQRELAVDSSALAGELIPRRLGSDEPTTVLDLAEVEASLAALNSPAAVEVLADIADPTLGLDAGSDSLATDGGLDFDFAVSELDSAAPGAGGLQVDDSAELTELELAGLGIGGDEVRDSLLAGEELNLDLSFTGSADDDGASFSSAADGESAEFQLDDDVAALAAQLDALEAQTGPAPSLVTDFDFQDARAENEGKPAAKPSPGAAKPTPGKPAAAAPVRPAPVAEAKPIVAAPAKKSSFGELSLVGMDDAAAAPPPPKPAPSKPGYDLSSVSLSLAPAEDADRAAETSAPARPAPAPAAAAAPTKPGYDFSSVGLSLAPTDDEVAEQAANDAAAVSSAAIRRVIVLGASIGGPDALRSFLAVIPKDFPALFLLAQHLESGFFSRLAQQLQKATPLQIRVAGDDPAPLRHGQVLVVPSSARYSVSAEGELSAEDYPEPPRYKPCIDDLLRAAADVFGRQVTAIIFSGMAGDAVDGASYVTARGGEVWAQDPSSCVVSSMVDGALARGVVEFVGSPRELAERCVARFAKS